MSRHSTALSREERTGEIGNSSDFEADCGTVGRFALDAFSVDEFAVRNGISRRQAYNEISTGRLIARKVNSRTIITREDAATWRRSLPRMPAAAPATVAEAPV